jgi:hypothetical protein
MKMAELTTSKLMNVITDWFCVSQNSKFFAPFGIDFN